MTIERIKDSGFWVSCDGCSAQEQLTESGHRPPQNFQDAIEAMNEKKWRFSDQDGTYTHYCPSCVEEGKMPETES